MRPNIIARLITEDITTNNGSDNLLLEWRGVAKRLFVEDIDKKVLDEVDKGCYVIRKEIWDGFGKPLKMTVCYSKKDDGYIGELEEAKFLCDKMGIAPERSDPSHSVCSIGFCSKDGKWYGWSHRVIHCFKVGDRKLKCFPDGDESGGVIRSDVEAKQAAVEFADSVS